MKRIRCRFCRQLIDPDDTLHFVSCPRIPKIRLCSCADPACPHRHHRADDETRDAGALLERLDRLNPDHLGAGERIILRAGLRMKRELEAAGLGKFLFGK